MSAPWIERRASSPPSQRIFGPTHGLDHRLFDGEKLKPAIREDLLGRWQLFCDAHGLLNGHVWAIVYFSGSEASEWTGPNREGNNDFDVLVGADSGRFAASNPRHPWVGLGQEALADELTKQLKASLADPAYVPPGCDPDDPFDQTWFCNAASFEIEDIKPYAAYNVTDDAWAVRPPHLPTWGVNDFPEGHPLVQFCQGFESLTRAALRMPEPYKHQECFRLWHHVHDTRSDAFGPRGEGWYDVPNVLEKWLDQRGLMHKLWVLMHEAAENPHLLDAPPDWSNTPVRD